MPSMLVDSIMTGALLRGIARIHNLAHVLGSGVNAVRLLPLLDKDNVSCIAGWGRRPRAERSRAMATRLRLPFFSLEDGFLRSCGLAVQGAQPLSLVADDLGIYYDATKPSRLEALITSVEMDAAMRADTTNALALIRWHQLSKYNHAPDAPIYGDRPGAKILVVDQAAGDLSGLYGAANGTVFHTMLHAALKENPKATVYLKLHPDVVAGKKQGCIDNVPPDRRIVVIDHDLNPLSLIGQMDKVYVATSHMGFEALILGKPVVCFGMPWYAGWGLTDDRHPHIGLIRQRRTVTRTLEQLFAAAYLQYSRYLQPETGKPGTIFHVIDHLIVEKKANNVRRGTLYCVGMSLWKRAAVAPFLAAPSARVRFVRSVAQLARMELASDAKLVVWGCGKEAQVAAFAKERNIALLRVEDGFLRSVGLGSELRRPLSLVLDSAGIYYDARTPSALEEWLLTTTLDGAARFRANLLIKRLVAMKLSKYNVGTAFNLDSAAKGRRVLLVPGQVEDDASIRFGSPSIATNAGLLETVRANNPDAYIVYKPHPDVASGNRSGAIAPRLMHKLADAVVADADIVDCIRQADEIHTMTSQAGFEALLYGKTVCCYGMPFYAGWGLTTDYLPLERRWEVDLATLAYGALIEYPDYIDPTTGKRVSAEQALNVLEQARQKAAQEALGDHGKFSCHWRRGKDLARTLRWSLAR